MYTEGTSPKFRPSVFIPKKKPPRAINENEIQTYLTVIMTKQNFPDNALYEMDNLPVLRGMNSETVDLIATDPPFNIKRNRSDTAGFYVDNWKWETPASYQTSGNGTKSTPSGLKR